MLNIIIKDLKLMLSDKKELAAIILMPVILTTILSFALSSSFQEAGSVFKLNIAIVKNYDYEEEKSDFESFTRSFSEQFNVDFEMSGESSIVEELDIEKIFFNDFLGSEEMKEFVEYVVCTEEEAYALLADKKASGIIIFPKAYIYDSYVNLFTTFRNNITMEVVSHPDMQYRRQIIEEIVSSFNNILTSISISKNVYLEKASGYMTLSESTEKIEAFIEKIGTEPLKLEIQTNNIQGKNFVNSFTYYSVGMLSMFILFSAGYGGKFILDEKNNTTYNRLLAGGIEKRRIIFGKFAMMFIMSALQSVVLIAYSKIAFRVAWLNLPLIMITVFVSSFAVASIGLFIIALTIKTNSYKATDAFSNAFVQFLALFGGSYIPHEILPKVIGEIGKYTPNGATMKAYLKILQGYGINEVYVDYGVIIVNICVMLIASYILLKEVDHNVKSVNAKI
jgi:ABC-2 type transport system permease protein